MLQHPEKQQRPGLPKLGTCQFYRTNFVWHVYLYESLIRVRLKVTVMERGTVKMPHRRQPTIQCTSSGQVLVSIGESNRYLPTYRRIMHSKEGITTCSPRCSHLNFCGKSCRRTLTLPAHGRLTSQIKLLRDPVAKADVEQTGRHARQVELQSDLSSEAFPPCRSSACPRQP